LLDCYPLKSIRLGSSFASQILKSVWDKKVYFLISAISAILTIYGHEIYRGLAPIEMFSLEHRFGNAVFGTTFYIIQSIAPINLLPFYPRQSLSIGNPLLLSTIVLYLVIAVTLIKISRKNKTLWPIVAVGIYLAMLLPVLGIFQGGNQGAGDRFTYMSTIPFFFLLGILLIKNISRLGIWVCLVAWSVLLLTKTISQQEIWQNDETFYRELTTKTAYRVASAYNKLGLILMDKNELDDAMAQFESALKSPGAPHELAGAANCIGNIYFTRNQFEPAEKYYNMAISYDASTFLAHNNLGNINALKGNPDAALSSYKKAIEIMPNYSVTYYNLAKLYTSLNCPKEAEVTYQKALEIDASLKPEK
jgi:Tfp pilus assembly protein PilF